MPNLQIYCDCKPVASAPALLTRLQAPSNVCQQRKRRFATAIALLIPSFGMNLI